MFDADALYPEILREPEILICPGTPCPESCRAPIDFIDDHSYFYLGYVVENIAQLRLLAEAYSSPEFDPAKDIKVPPGEGNAGGDTIYRLREGLERTLAQPSQEESWRFLATIPVMLDRPGPWLSSFNHKEKGGHVLFLDGHVEFVRYPGDFPMTEEALMLLDGMDALGRREP